MQYNIIYIYILDTYIGILYLYEIVKLMFNKL